MELRFERLLGIFDRDVCKKSTRRSGRISTAELAEIVLGDFLHVLRLHTLHRQYDQALVRQPNVVVLREQHDGDQPRQNSKADQSDEEKDVRLFHSESPVAEFFTFVEMRRKGRLNFFVSNLSHNNKSVSQFKTLEMSVLCKKSSADRQTSKTLLSRDDFVLGFLMFTGIVEECGVVTQLKPVETGAELWVRSSFSDETELGESVAVNGACLTVTEVKDGAMRFDLLHETLRLTNLGDLVTDAPVNLERSLRIGDRLSGHFVQGHVDACTEVLTYQKVGQDHKFVVSLPKEFAHLMVHKGSICVNGISLTVAELEEDSFTLWIIPHTHEVTSLKSVQAGSKVNLEFDLLAKHIARITELGQA